MDRGAWSAPLSMGSQRVRHTEGLSMHTRACGHVHTHAHIHALLCYWVMNSCLTICDLMDCSSPGLPVPYYCPKFAQTHVCWVGDAIQQSHPLSFPFSSCPQSFLKSESFPMGWLFASGGQSIGASVLVPSRNIQDWCPVGLTGLISLQSKGLSRVFSDIAIQKHQFFGTQPSLWSSTHIYTWLLDSQPQTLVIICWLVFLPVSPAFHLWAIMPSWPLGMESVHALSASTFQMFP